MNENEAERLFEIRKEEKKNMKDLKSLQLSFHRLYIPFSSIFFLLFF